MSDPSSDILRRAYVLEATGEPLVRRDGALAAPGPGDAVVEVSACGLCHTDLGYASGEVRPNHELPLVLGHEVVGTVVNASQDPGPQALIGRQVLVPAVLPCGECAWCAAGRANACPTQRMPGNDLDGGFASHMVVPARFLVPIDDAPANIDRRSLSVVADAVSTAWQAVHRSGLKSEDVALVVGAGGVGGYVSQIARAKGATVIACDVDAGRLEGLSSWLHCGVDVTGRGPREVRREVRSILGEIDAPSVNWRVFECSGNAAGQQLAYSLLGRAATMVVVGYTFDKVELRLSNLMALDAQAIGTWGCPPEAYPDVLRLVYDGVVRLDPFIEHRPMSAVNDHLAEMSSGALKRRVVMDPRA